jgi:hypothetical protein
MSTAPDLAVDLLAVVSEPHSHALAALDEPEGEGLAAVAWCSAHLVAADRVLYAAVRKSVPRGRRELRAVRAVDHALQHAVFRLDRRLTGAVHLVALPVAVFAADVRTALRAHADAERRLVELLQERLSPQEQQALADALPAAMADAPTRPHPHTRHTPLAGLVARVDAGVDRVRDVLDNRVAPLGRRRRPARPMGRWGAYLTGTPYPEEPQPRSVVVRR